MTIAPHRTEALPAEPLKLLHNMLEEQFALHTNRLTELIVYGRLPGHGGYSPRSLDVLAAAARQSIADTAAALRRMTEGTYGICDDCHRPIPLGRLRILPQARYCTRCDVGGPEGIVPRIADKYRPAAATISGPITVTYGQPPALKGAEA